MRVYRFLLASAGEKCHTPSFSPVYFESDFFKRSMLDFRKRRSPRAISAFVIALIIERLCTFSASPRREEAPRPDQVVVEKAASSRSGDIWT